MKWHGITIHGHDGSGVWLGNGSRNITLRNLHIYDNGEVSGGKPHPRGKSEGILLDGSDIVIESVDIHDNAADAIQAGGSASNVTLRKSHLHNTRMQGGDAFNRCTHQDGIQMHRGGLNVLIEDNVF